MQDNTATIVFTAINRAGVQLEVVHNAAHAMALVWTRFMDNTPIHVLVQFDDYIRHPETGRIIDVQAVVDPVKNSVRIAAQKLATQYEGVIPLEIGVIVSAAHEMMHIVQIQQGEELAPSFTESLEIQEAYHDSRLEREARLVALDVLKSMVPSIEGHFTRANGEQEHIPEKGSFDAANHYRIELLTPSWRDRLCIWRDGLLRRHTPFCTVNSRR